MSDRHQILDDAEFWTWLEYGASNWIEGSDDTTLRRFWIDGFWPESATDTKRGVDVEGTAYVCGGQRTGHYCRFTVSLPQKLLHRRREAYSIEQLILDEAQQTLQIEIVHEKRVA